MEDDAKKSGWLGKAFKLAVKVGIGLSFFAASSAFGMVVWDPTMLPVLHDATNYRAQALIATLKDYTSWIPRHLGLMEDEGLMSGIMDSFLADKIEMLTPLTDSQAASSYTQGNGINLKDINQFNDDTALGF